MSRRRIRLIVAALAAMILAAFGASATASASSTAGAAMPRATAVAAKNAVAPYFHTSTVCAASTRHGASATTCPPASVYTKWAHTSYHVGGTSTASHTTSGTASGKVSPNTNASCEIYVSDLWLSGGTITGETVNTCVGSFSYQYIGEQTWRSSWSGWRGYDAWSWTPDEYGQPQIDYYWYIGCNGPGTYDYIQVAYGAPDGVAGPQTRSLNSQRWACGANA